MWSSMRARGLPVGAADANLKCSASLSALVIRLEGLRHTNWPRFITMLKQRGDRFSQTDKKHQMQKKIAKDALKRQFALRH